MPPPDANEQADQGVGPAPVDHLASNPVVRSVEKAVIELQSARAFIERDLESAKGDIKNMLTRLAKLEEKVDALPSKTWIGSVVLGGMTFLGALVAILSKIFGH